MGFHGTCLRSEYVKTTQGNDGSGPCVWSGFGKAEAVAGCVLYREQRPEGCIDFAITRETIVNMKIRTQSVRSGFTLIEIMIVVAIIGMLMTIAVPNVVKARKTAQKNACLTNMKNIESTIEQFKLENRTAPADLNALVAGGYFKTVPTCPAGGTYTIPASDEGEVTCSIAEHNSTVGTAAATGEQ